LAKGRGGDGLLKAKWVAIFIKGAYFTKKEGNGNPLKRSKMLTLPDLTAESIFQINSVRKAFFSTKVRLILKNL